MKFRRSRLFSIVSALALLLLFIVGPERATATGETLSLPQDISISSGQSGVQLGDDFSVSGFAGDSVLLTTISVSGETSALFSIQATSGLSLEYGYYSWVGVSSVSFTGNQSDTNAALDSISIATGQTAGVATLTVSVQEQQSGSSFFDGTGHLYEFVPNGSISYMDARLAAEQRELNGLTGYLVTITSEDEHSFVLTKIQDAYNIWISLSDRVQEGVWRIDSGPEAGTVVWNGQSDGIGVPGQYAYWCGGEPNDWGGYEDATVTKWNGGNCWNDLPHENYDWVGGYVVEYEPLAGQVLTESMSITISDSPPDSTTTTTTTTLPPLPNCGPYGDMYVTGTNAGPIWGSGPYTDDSNIGGAAVHAGLIGIGESATLRAVDVAYYQSFIGNTQNGITTMNWTTGWCGFNLSLVIAPPNTTSTTTTTVFIPPTTTTIPQVTTTTTIYIPPTTTTVPETTTTSSVPVPETTLPVPGETSTPESTLPKQPEREITPSTRPEITPTTLVDVQPESPTTTIPKQQQEEEIQEPSEQVSPTSTIPSNTNLINSLETAKPEEIASIVSAVLANGVTQEAAQQLATSPEVLNSVNSDQATEIFSAIDADNLTEDVADQIVDAVQEAPSEVREVFEETVDLFQGAFDGYKMLGQTITVGERRTVVAVTALTTAIAGATAAGSMGGGSGGGAGGGGSSGNDPRGTNDAARREDEQEEPSGEIAGDGVEWIHNIKVFKYIGGVRVLDMKSFGKKFVYGVMNLGFTLAGSLVVYLTLSGPIQVIAGITTVAAFGAAMWLHMKEPE